MNRNNIQVHLLRTCSAHPLLPCQYAENAAIELKSDRIKQASKYIFLYVYLLEAKTIIHASEQHYLGLFKFFAQKASSATSLLCTSRISCQGEREHLPF
jgi:hypothetical protein